MVSFPFPKEAAEVVKGDYANASIRASINLRTVIPPGAPNPIPPIELPDPGQVLTDVPEVPAERRPDQQGVHEGAQPTSTCSRS